MFFGPVEDVAKDLEAAAKSLAQAQIVHANDFDTLAVLMNRAAVIKHLREHDLDKLPVYPVIGTGQSQLRFKENPNVAFINQIKVSIRGDKAVDEKVNTPLNIVLPPGVRL